MRWLRPPSSFNLRAHIRRFVQSKWFSWGILAIGPLAAFATVYRFILAHFYSGAYLLDGGLFAELIWRNWALLSHHAPGGASYYSVHTTPFFSVLSAISYALPWNKTGYFAAFIGAISLAGVSLVVLVLYRKRATPIDHLLTTLVAGMFAFSGVMVEPVLYPHYEHLMPIGAVAFIACLLLGRLPKLRWGIFAITLLLREDGGLHLGALLGCLILAKALGVKVPGNNRRLLLLLVVATSASAAMFLIHRYAVPASYSAFDGAFAADHSVLQRLYESGELWRRFQSFLRDRTGLYLPLVLTAFYAVHCRDAGFLIGYASNVPWFLLLITADYNVSSSFSLYYPFPFIIGHLWCIVWAVLRGTPRRHALGMALTLNLVAYQSNALPRLFEMRLSYRQIVATERFARVLETRLQSPVAKIATDAATAALVPKWVRPEWIVSADTPTPKEADILVFSGCYRNDRERVHQFIVARGLYHVAAVNGTEFHIATSTSSVVKPWKLPARWAYYTDYRTSIKCGSE